MSEEKAIVPIESGNWRTQVLLIGGALGTLVGLGAAYLYVRAAEDARGGEPPSQVQARDAVKVGLSLLGVLRMITELGSRRE